ncbi:hypothetical protein [Nocardioides sp.]
MIETMLRPSDLDPRVGEADQAPEESPSVPLAEASLQGRGSE